MIEMGILTGNKSSSESAVVFAEGWPSWYFAIEGLGFDNIKVCSKASLSTMGELRATRIKPHLISEVEMIDALASATVLFVQGSQDFCTYVHNGYVIHQAKHLKVIDVVNDMPSTTVDGLRLTHEEVGGVVAGSWSFYASGTELKVDTSTHTRRRLKHVLKDTEKESSKRSLKISSTSLLKPDMLLPAGWIYPSVRTPSVFKKMEDVSRLMTDQEVMAAYDVEEDLQAELLSYCNKEGVALSRAFTQETPVKLLRRVGESLFDSVMHLRSNTEIKDVLGIADDVSIASDSTLKASNVSRFTLGDDDTVLGESTEKAARPDDAEADCVDWDKYSVENFGVTISRAGKEVKPLVCNGDYHPVHHTRLFNSLRSMLHRRYRKNVTRSFFKFLRAKYKRTERDTIFNLDSDAVKLDDIEQAANKLAEKGIWASEEAACVVSSFPAHDGVDVRYTLQNWISLKSSGKKVELPRRKKRKKSTKLHEDLLKDLEVGCDAISRAANSSWWDWTSGSTLFFWRWPSRLHKVIRDGTKVFVDKKLLPNYKNKPSWPSEYEHYEKLKSKIQKVRGRGYIRPGFVRSLTGYFAVPKAETDIRVVYDATKCGLNDAVWAPNFFLPTVDSILRNACSFTWFGDIDLGEMFLNYFLDEELRPYAGVDVTELEEGAGGRVFEQWIRTLMGFRCSPYIATQTFAWSEEIVVGDLSDPNNPFAWDEVKLNLPGTEGYDPSMPWIYKWNSVANCMPAFFGTYVDDVRSGASSESSCRTATRRIASIVNYLGQQDAARKRRPPSQTPGPWAGAKCLSIAGDGLYVMSTQGKWEKAQNIISKWKTVLEGKATATISFKEMEQDVGFLCHISRTYPKIFPYLKGFYNTLNSWRFDRDSDGWKVTSKTALMEMMAGDLFIDVNLSSLEHSDLAKSKMWIVGKKNAPSEVVTVPRFKNDIQSLSVLMDSLTPPLRLIRGESLGKAIYGFGDASGKGFGSSWEVNGNVIFRFGIWGEEMDLTSSNYKEASNDVKSVEAMGEQGLLEGTEVFFFTDNSTAEAIFFNGSSKSPLLFELVLRLHKIEMNFKCKVHFIHCAGTRMISQGTDGLSRGNLLSGVMAGRAMTEFVPIHLSALERCDKLKSWLQSFVDESTEFLSPEDWFRRGHDIVPDEFEINVDGLKLPRVRTGTFVWTPPPCLAEVAIEELRKARHKRTSSQHLFIVPRLMQPTYLKHLHKAADLIISVPIGHPAWPESMFEPLTVAFVFPFLSHRPWQLRGSDGLLELGRSVLRMWAENIWEDRFVLRKLWLYQRELASMPEKLASEVLQGKRPLPVSHQSTRKRRGISLGKEERGGQIPKRQKRG